MYRNIFKNSLVMIGGVLNMDNPIIERTRLNVSLIMGYIINLVGGYDNYLSMLVTFTIIDIITGFVKAVVNKTISINKMFIGGYRKFTIALFLVIATKIDNTIPDMFIRQATIFYFLATELTSIVENISEFNNVPQQIKDLSKYFESKSKGEISDED